MKPTYHTIASEENALVIRAQAGDRAAAQTLLQAHDPFLRKMAHHYSRVEGYEYEDALQDARAGFLKGIERFKVKKGFRLLTYATWWMRHEVRRSLQNTVGDVRTPVWKQERDKVMPIRAKRLDAVVSDGDEEGKTFGETLPGNDVPPDEAAHENWRQRRMREIYLDALVCLTARERAIVIERLARDEKDRTTFELLGKKLGLSRERERVRQIERDVKVKLRLALTRRGARGLVAA